MFGFESEDPEDIIRTLSEKRISLRSSLENIEKAAEAHILETMDHVQKKIANVGDCIENAITRPFHLIQEKVEELPTYVRSKPVQTFLVVSSLSFVFGYFWRRRTMRRTNSTRARDRDSYPDLRLERTRYDSGRTTILSMVVREVASELVKQAVTKYHHRSEMSSSHNSD